MDRDTELMADHLPLEEILLTEIDGIEPPDNWSREEGDETPELPPVLIEEDRGYTLVGNHRTVWHLKTRGRTMVKCLVVRSTVHVRPAHALIGNCTEEAMLFEGILRREIVTNRSRLADMLGYSRARITQLLNLLKLPREIRQKVLITDDISEFQLRQLLKVLDDDQRLQTGFKKMLEKKLSGRQMALFASREVIPGEAGQAELATEPEVSGEPEETLDSLSELEGVFQEEEIASTDSSSTKRVEKETPVEAVEEAPRKAEESLDLRLMIREIGNLRSQDWRSRAAQHKLTPLVMDFLEGVSFIRTGLYEKANSILTEVVSDDSSFHLAWFYLGRCANLTGSLQEAEEYLRNAISSKPEDPDYIVELAIVLEKLKRHSEAEAFYRKSAQIRKKLAAGK